MILNYYNAPGKKVPKGGRKDMRGSNNGAGLMLSKASFGQQKAIQGLKTRPRNNNVPSKSYGGSRIGKGPVATIMRSSGRGRRFGVLG